MLQIVKHKKSLNDKGYDLKNLLDWIEQHVEKPIKGFEHKRNADGSFFNYQQQLDETHKQIFYIAKYYLLRGKSYDEIIRILQLFKDK